MAQDHLPKPTLGGAPKRGPSQIQGLSSHPTLSAPPHSLRLWDLVSPHMDPTPNHSPVLTVFFSLRNYFSASGLSGFFQHLREAGDTIMYAHIGEATKAQEDKGHVPGSAGHSGSPCDQCPRHPRRSTLSRADP